MSDRNQRLYQREKYRISCEFRDDGKTHTGFVMDVSARGIFVQATHLPKEGAEIRLVLHDGERGQVALQGRVVRHRVSHRSAVAVARSGFAVEIVGADEDFFALLVKLGLG